MDNNYRVDVQAELAKMDTIINKARSIGGSAIKLPVENYCVTLVSFNKDRHRLYIPNDVIQSKNKELPSYYDEEGEELDISLESIGEILNKLSGELTVIGGANLISTSCLFRHCANIKHLNLLYFDTRNVEDMSYMFEYCKVGIITFGNFNTSRVKNMSHMFYNCEVDKLDLSTFNTSNVTNMNSMFEQCKSKSIDLSTFDISNVDTLDNMFARCKTPRLNLTSFVCKAPRENTQHMFEGCISDIKVSNVRMEELIAYR